MPASLPQLATCLGCGCLCDDIQLTIAENKIVSLENACPLGERWFGDGDYPTRVEVDGRPAAIDVALRETADRLVRNPASLLILISDDLSIEAHRGAVALSDWLGATIDGLAADTVASGMLAAARRGRVSGTLGELRHRADLVLWWGCDPMARYPRFVERFIDAPSQFVKQRRQIGIDIGAATGPSALRHRLEINPGDELDTIGELRAHLAERLFDPPSPTVQTLLEACQTASNIAILFDAEPTEDFHDPGRAESLLGLAQQLHDTRRASVWGLRAGGNRNGFESVLTWQTGFPMSVDFGTGHPAFVVQESVAERLARGRYQTALVIGSPDSIPAAIRERLAGIETIAIGPVASEADFHPHIRIDTGRAGIHEDGIVLRMDDVPLETFAFIEHPHEAGQLINRLVELTCQRKGQTP